MITLPKTKLRDQQGKQDMDAIHPKQQRQNFSSDNKTIAEDGTQKSFPRTFTRSPTAMCLFKTRRESHRVEYKETSLILRSSFPCVIPAPEQKLPNWKDLVLAMRASCRH